MKNAKISELRDHLSEYLAKVRRGETVIVYDRDVPIARLEPIPPPEEGLPDFYDRAIRQGMLRPAKKRDGALKNLPPPPKPKRPARLLEALIEERRTGR
jgi:antitoxin (DNA-binding transcriptional repressor) of toxin-antitoxin stability system